MKMPNHLSEPVTKADLEHLKLFMMAGFEMCATLMYQSMMASQENMVELQEELQSVARIKARQTVRPMVESLYQHMLKEYGDLSDNH